MLLPCYIYGYVHTQSMDEIVLREVISEELSRIQRLLLTPDVEVVENLTLRMESLYGHLLRMHQQGVALDVVNEEVLEVIRKILHIISLTCQELEIDSSTENQHLPLITMCRQRAGRPRYDLPRGQLRFFIEHGFSCSRISAMLGISQSTINRRMSEYGLSIRSTYSDIAEHDLKDIICQVHESFPNAGYRLILGWLNQRGLRVQESRVRRLMREVDPIGVTNRFFRSIYRRTYTVGGPQSLWHLDGNHKLIKLVVIVMQGIPLIWTPCGRYVCLKVSGVSLILG